MNVTASQTRTQGQRGQVARLGSRSQLGGRSEPQAQVLVCVLPQLSR
jgi:hypothetical protein